jgi:hypothetical protein
MCLRLQVWPTLQRLECKPAPLSAFFDGGKNATKVKRVAARTNATKKDGNRWQEQYKSFVKRFKLPMTEVKARIEKLRDSGYTDRSAHIIAMHLVHLGDKVSKAIVIVQHDQNPSRSRASVDHAPCICPHGAYYISTLKRDPHAKVFASASSECRRVCAFARLCWHCRLSGFGKLTVQRSVLVLCTGLRTRRPQKLPGCRKALVGASALLKDMVGNSFTSNVMLAVMLAMMPQWNRKPEQLAVA